MLLNPKIQSGVKLPHSKEMLMKPLAVVCGVVWFLLATFSVGAQTPAPAQGWPQYRKENTLGARVDPLPVPPRPPGTFFGINTGGSPASSMVGDLSGTGVADIVMIRNGRISATRNGQLLFDNFYGMTDIATITDLDGDGPAEIIAFGTVTQDLMVIQSDGGIRRSFRFPEFTLLAAPFIKVADLIPTRPGKEIVVFPDHTATEGDAMGYFFDSQLQTYATPVVKNLNGGQLNSPQLAIGDVDSNGVLDVVVIGRPWLLIYNVDGTLRSQTEFREGDPEGRHYGLMTLANVDADPKDLEVVVIGDEIPVLTGNGKLQAITVFKLTPTPTRLWGGTFPNENPRACLNSVVDLNGDGRAEIVLNVWDKTTQNIRIYNGTGDANGNAVLLVRLANHYVWDIRDINGDGVPELYTSQATEEFPSMTLASVLEVYAFSLSGNTGALQLYGKTLTQSQYLLRSVCIPDLPLIGASNETRIGLLMPNRAPFFFSYFQQKRNGKVRLTTATPTPEGITVDLSLVRSGNIRTIWRDPVSGLLKFLVAEEINGALTGKVGFYEVESRRKALPAASSFVASPSSQLEPRVADLDGDGVNEILLRLPSRRIGVFSCDPLTGTTQSLTTFEGTSVPLINELDIQTPTGNRPEILVTRNDAGRLRISALESSGTFAAGTFAIRERWGVTFPEYPSDTALTLVTGKFLGAAQAAGVFISISRTGSLLLSGAQGNTVWRTNEAFFFSNAVSVRDYDGDGDDDIYIVSNDKYSIRDGATGKALFGPVEVRTLKGDLYSSAVLLPAGEVLLAGPARVVRIAKDNKRIWDFAKIIGTEAVMRINRAALPGVAPARFGSADVFIGANYGPEGTFSVYRMSDGVLVKRTGWWTSTDIVTVLGSREGDPTDGLNWFVFGTADGQLVAVRADTGDTVWQLPLGAFATSPVIAQVGASKTLCLIFSTGDGQLRVYPL